MRIVSKARAINLQTNNKSKAARIIGYSRISVHRWIKSGIKKKICYGGWVIYFDE